MFTLKPNTHIFANFTNFCVKNFCNTKVFLQIFALNSAKLCLKICVFILCEHALNEAIDIESQIQTAFDYYAGTSEAHTFSYLGFDGCRIEGEWIDKHSIVRIKDIRTSTGKTYWITYTEYIAFDADSGRIGIIGMSLRDENLNVIAEIG